MVLECYDLLKRIEPRPAMWLGENTLHNLYLYTSGYYAALLELKAYSVPDTTDPFFDWTAKRLGYYESTAGWVNMIVAHSLGFDPQQITWEEVLEYKITPEQHALSVKIFYQLLEEFKVDVS